VEWAFFYEKVAKMVKKDGFLSDFLRFLSFLLGFSKPPLKKVPIRANVLLKK